MCGWSAPSCQDRILGPQEEFGIYRPIDLSRVDASLFIPDLLAATTVEGEAYGVPHLWGVSGFAVDRSVAGDILTYTDLCTAPHAGRISMRTRRIALLGFAFAAGEDPFAAYAWINFVMRPEIAAQIVNAAGSFSASAGSDDLVNPTLRAAYQDAFSSEVIANIRWFPPIPAGLEAIEGRPLDRIAPQSPLPRPGAPEPRHRATHA